MTLRITPQTTMGELAGRAVVVSSAFLTGPLAPFVLDCSDKAGQVSVRHAPISGGSSETALVPRYRTLAHFARDRLRIVTIGKITPIVGVGWPAGSARLRLPNGLTTEDLYPGLRELHGPKLSVHSYILGAVEAPVGAVNPDVARQRVDAVKETYGALLSDIAYRIENSALFDNAVPESKEFQLHLMRWQDQEAHLDGADLEQAQEHRLDGAALDALAREVALAFDTARANAERLGLSHLPLTARRTARQAIKAAALARDSSTEGERAAAREKVAKLLSRLALYYLPSPRSAPFLLGGHAPQLPTRGTS